MHSGYYSLASWFEHERLHQHLLQPNAPLARSPARHNAITNHTTGDSLTRLSTTTLASVLRAKPLENDMWKDVWEACGGDLKVTFIRSDCLDARAAPDFASNQCEEFPGGPVMSQFFCQLFGTDEILREFDTLVVNSGAHPRPADQFGREMDAAADALTSSMNRLHGKDKAILVVRNTVPGHWGCTER